jgi:tripartite-type tricarboxylate transporter receptor subunit TctC
MAVELFAHAAGIQLQHVPYRGGAQAITDTIGGQVPLVAVNALEVQPHVKTGKLKVLASLSDKRTPIFPDTPTIAESGWPGFEASVWYGLLAPAATPKAVVERLHAEVQSALQTQDVKTRMTGVGGEVIPGTAQEFAKLIHDERVRYDKIVRDAHIKAD